MTVMQDEDHPRDRRFVPATTCHGPRTTGSQVRGTDQGQTTNVEPVHCVWAGGCGCVMQNWMICVMHGESPVEIARNEDKGVGIVYGAGQDRRAAACINPGAHGG